MDSWSTLKTRDLSLVSLPMHSSRGSPCDSCTTSAIPSLSDPELPSESGPRSTSLFGSTSQRSSSRVLRAGNNFVCVWWGGGVQNSR